MNNKETGDRTVHVQCMFSFLHATHGLKNHLTITNYDMIVRLTSLLGSFVSALYAEYRDASAADLLSRQLKIGMPSCCHVLWSRRSVNR